MMRLVELPLVLLHGFAGRAASWDATRAALTAARGGEPYPVVAVDLRGHGTAASRRPITVEACVADVLAAAPDRFLLGGYSLGGRVALHVAAAAPQRVLGLALVATTAGLADPEQRAARAAADDELATRLLADGLPAFAAAWSTQPLFAGDPPQIRAAQRAEVSAGEPEALAAVLRGLSPGVVPSCWDALPGIAAPVEVLVGARDPRYVAIGTRLAAALPDARRTVVDGAGHGLLREAPAAVAAGLLRLVSRTSGSRAPDPRGAR